MKRIKFVYDEDAHFEECNGKSRPLTRKEYSKNSYRACPQHPRAGTRVIKSAYYGRPQVQGCAVCGNTQYRTIPYAEYLAYYGNPDRHVYLCAICEVECPHCGQWHYGSSLGWIDFMDDSPEYLRISIDRWYDEAESEHLPGYLKDVAQELLKEAA